ncbi:right-handed parallel beta-helix repeat-containing protein [Micromonospora sp. CPCC 205539]|uniref:right-handed parallel beta-helix repeat-containing protein n=1 Tax=Micromonospora sp. CPCC 205539 TaxID=3122408 RepID=UPI002FF21EA5
MRKRALARLALVPLLAAAGMVGSAASAAPATAAANESSELYVSNKYCSPTGVQNGSPEAPFCTIQAASAVAGPGQTVLVQPGVYRENVSFNRSGTESAPITFRAVYLANDSVRVGKYETTAVTGAVMVISGVHDVVIEGFDVYGADRSDAIAVIDSSRITLDKMTIHGGSLGPTGVEVSGVSDDVTISRGLIQNTSGPALDLDPGTTNVTVTGNQLIDSGLLATVSPGLTVTGNTVVTDCRPGIDLYASSTGASVRNNIVQTSKSRQPCANPAGATAIRVDSSSASDTTADYNLVDPLSGGPIYTWAGEAYAALAPFTTATGQGTHDLHANPLLTLQQFNTWSSWYGTGTASPARDSADAAAPGALDTDLLDNSYADDPQVPNTGTGSQYRDRGAVETQGPRVTDPQYLRRKAGGGPFDVVAGQGIRSSWTVEQQRAKYAYQFYGDFYETRYWHVTDSNSVEHTFRRGGRVCVQMQGSQRDFRSSDSYRTEVCTVVGARYVPVTPTRLLDTRTGLGTTSKQPLGQDGSVVMPITSLAGVPVADITAVVLNVSVTQPTESGYIVVYPWGAVPNASTMNFVPGETVANQVTVPVWNGHIAFTHRGLGQVHVVADLQGVYTASGSGYASMSPARMLDTREGPAGPIAANATRTLDLSSKLPSDATAAVLNVTATGPTANGFLTLFPYGGTAPTASHLNYVPGQTIPNLVTVPVVNGRVNIRSASSGTTHVVVDLAGWFSPSATQTFVPLDPTRVLDTRDGTGRGTVNAPLRGFETIRVDPRVVAATCNPACPAPTAMVTNLTVTAPTTAGVLIAHPGGQQRPTASNVNFVARETASNAALVGVGAGVDVYNNSSGQTHAIVDQLGYFIGPPA